VGLSLKIYAATFFDVRKNMVFSIGKQKYVDFCHIDTLSKPVFEIILEPRIWFMNTYKDIENSPLHLTQKAADYAASKGRIECIEIREVLKAD